MKRQLQTLLDQIGESYKALIDVDSRHYIEVDIGLLAQKMGYTELDARFRGAHAIVPLKTPVAGMKVRIDGRTFVNYRQHPSGIAVPGYVAKAAGRKFNVFRPNDSMILNCT